MAFIGDKVFNLTLDAVELADEGPPLMGFAGLGFCPLTLRLDGFIGFTSGMSEATGAVLTCMPHSAPW